MIGLMSSTPYNSALHDCGLGNSTEFIVCEILEVNIASFALKALHAARVLLGANLSFVLI